MAKAAVREAGLAPAKRWIRDLLPHAPEDCLEGASQAADAESRLRFARAGLSSAEALDPEMQALLLRQLHLGLYEQGHFAESEEVALQGAALLARSNRASSVTSIAARDAEEEGDSLEDVLLQGAARAALAQGDGETAIAHVRRAARKAPKARRAFHHWTLGALLFLAKRYTEAATSLARAVRLSASDSPAKALYRAHWALVLVAQGDPPKELQALVNALAAAPSGNGYGAFVLGHLAYAAGEFTVAERYLRRFLAGTSDAALAGEIAMTQATLAKIVEG